MPDPDRGGKSRRQPGVQRRQPYGPHQRPDPRGVGHEDQRGPQVRLDRAVEQDQFGDQLQRDRHDAKAADMRIGHYRQKSRAILMRGAAGVREIGEAIEMQRAGHRDPRDEPRQRAGPRIDPRARPGGTGDERADHQPDRRKPAHRPCEILRICGHAWGRQARQELQREDEAFHG